MRRAAMVCQTASIRIATQGTSGLSGLEANDDPKPKNEDTEGWVCVGCDGVGGSARRQWVDQLGRWGLRDGPAMDTRDLFHPGFREGTKLRPAAREARGQPN